MRRVSSFLGQGESFTVSLYILYCRARVYNRDAGVIGCGGALQGVHKKRRKRRLRKKQREAEQKSKKKGGATLRRL